MSSSQASERAEVSHSPMRGDQGVDESDVQVVASRDCEFLRVFLSHHQMREIAHGLAVRARFVQFISYLRYSRLAHGLLGSLANFICGLCTSRTIVKHHGKITYPAEDVLHEKDAKQARSSQLGWDLWKGWTR